MLEAMSIHDVFFRQTYLAQAKISFSKDPLPAFIDKIKE